MIFINLLKKTEILILKTRFRTHKKSRYNLRKILMRSFIYLLLILPLNSFAKWEYLSQNNGVTQYVDMASRKFDGHNVVRREETRKALALIGLEPEFLGFPDTKEIDFESVRKRLAQIGRAHV